MLGGSAITRVPADRIRRVGVRSALEPVPVALKRRVSRVYLHLDFDVLDPVHFPVAAAGVASYDPECDETGTVWHAAVQALELLVRGL